MNIEIGIDLSGAAWWLIFLVAFAPAALGGFAPVFLVRLIARVYPKGHPRRRELPAEMPIAIKYNERIPWLAEAFATAITDGLPARLGHTWSTARSGAHALSYFGDLINRTLMAGLFGAFSLFAGVAWATTFDRATAGAVVSTCAWFLGVLGAAYRVHTSLRTARRRLDLTPELLGAILADCSANMRAQQLPSTMRYGGTLADRREAVYDFVTDILERGKIVRTPDGYLVGCSDNTSVVDGVTLIFVMKPWTEDAPVNDPDQWTFKHIRPCNISDKDAGRVLGEYLYKYRGFSPDSVVYSRRRRHG